METVVIVIHLMVIIALVAVVLMQRSEGGALGIGGGGNFMSARGTGNVLTRTTAILAVAFFATSIILTILTRYADRPASILDNVPAANTTAPAPVGGSADGSVLDQLDRMTPAPDAAQPPAAAEPATTTPQVPQ
jgi:preprotein translocase subunit SecG